MLEGVCSQGWFPESFFEPDEASCSSDQDAAAREADTLTMPGWAGRAKHHFRGDSYGQGYLSFTPGLRLFQMPHAEAGGGWAFGDEALAMPGWTGRAKHDFRGDSYGQGYLSFTRGLRLFQMPHAEAGGGWAFGMLEGVCSQGWFPESFFEPDEASCSSDQDAAAREADTLTMPGWTGRAKQHFRGDSYGQGSPQEQGPAQTPDMKKHVAVVGLGAALERMSLVAALPGVVTPFHSTVPPRMDIHKYVACIGEHFGCSSECFVLGLLYIDRLVKAHPRMVMSPLSCHRCVLTSVMLAAKFHDDVVYRNTYYAEVGGVRVQELNALERLFVSLLGWKLNVHPEEYELYQGIVVNMAAAVDRR
jgi:hypothetical protein